MDMIKSMKKKVVIVGAGVAGLSVGVYAQQSGFDVNIYESRTIPGGVFTSWRRKGYLFEGGIHWFTGSSAKASLNRLWREVKALDDTTLINNQDPFFTIQYHDHGQTAFLYRDREKLQQHLLELPVGN